MYAARDMNWHNGNARNTDPRKLLLGARTDFGWLLLDPVKATKPVKGEQVNETPRLLDRFKLGGMVWV